MRTGRSSFVEHARRTRTPSGVVRNTPKPSQLIWKWTRACAWRPAVTALSAGKPLHGSGQTLNSDPPDPDARSNAKCMLLPVTGPRRIRSRAHHDHHSGHGRSELIFGTARPHRRPWCLALQRATVRQSTFWYERTPEEKGEPGRKID
jgi:hypothetical protein